MSKEDNKVRWDVFSQKYVETGNGVQSYLIAFPNAKYDSAKSNAKKLLTKTYIQDRINVLREQYQEKYFRSLDQTIADLKATAEEAKLNRNYNAYAKIEDMIIKIQGFYTPVKTDITSAGEKISINLNLGLDD
jgi:hypothetical protein